MALLVSYTAEHAGFYVAGKTFCAFIEAMKIISLLVRMPEIVLAKAA